MSNKSLQSLFTKSFDNLEIFFTPDGVKKNPPCTDAILQNLIIFVSLVYT